ncbi:L-rhamnose-binding lectin CSL2 [Labeo rohita]|uniref:L-rhamnose-binding lectin CSL2 n=1 Tax=Labeo rohita TaxID=84645 RepID=A0ABQ8MW85_LABRO|nr:L-rhamnose-binding lectin CSL2 [Labeo rohita]
MGFIHVLDANYGRTDPNKCSEGKTSNELSNVHCFQETSLRTMTVRCNGRKSCTLSAVNSVFSDPCSWTYKYLNLSYECRPLNNSDVISIHHANYGRRDFVTCPYRRAMSECYFTQTTSMRSRCNEKKSCDLDASNWVFSDPCYRVHKYLEVTYSCV